MGRGCALPGSSEPSQPSLWLPIHLFQVHKFLNRNRDHLDPTVVGMLAQSQLQVPRQPSCSAFSIDSCPRGSPEALAPGDLAAGLPAELWDGRTGPRAAGSAPSCLQLVGILFQEAEPQAGGERDKPTLASRFLQTLGDLLAHLGR